MWPDHIELLKREYFPEKNWVNTEGTANYFDIQVDRNRCSQFKTNGTICDLCFNIALLEKLQELSSLERLDFVNYQINKYSNPIDWLRRFQAFLKDNEDNFDSSNLNAQREFIEITRQGMNQLSKKNPKSDVDHNEF